MQMKPRKLFHIIRINYNSALAIIKMKLRDIFGLPNKLLLKGKYIHLIKQII